MVGIELCKVEEPVGILCPVVSVEGRLLQSVLSSAADDSELRRGVVVTPCGGTEVELYSVG